MTKEEAREAAYAKAFDAGCKITTGNYFGSNTDEKTRAMFGTVWDAAIDYAAANQWTYLPELPTESAYYCATRQLQSGRTYVWQSYFDLNRSEWTIGLNERVIAWRSLPPPAEIKRSEDEV